MSDILCRMITAKPPMTAEQLVAALDELEMEQLELARLLGVDGKTVRRWTAPGGEAPGYASLFVRLLIARPSLKALVGARKRSGRGRPPKSRT